MRNEIQGNSLILYFEGEVNSYNAEAVEKDAFATIAGKSFDTLVLDFSSLKYISSAGLRVLLKLKQKFDKLVIKEASLEVYDVLEMTGFTTILEVHKALARIDVRGASIIGKGFFSTVYRINGDTIIKVFNRVSDPQQIERELSLAKQAFVLGIPTAISFDIVRVDDKLGVRFEMLDCISLQEAFVKYPERFDSLLERYVALLKKINTTESIDPNLPDIRKFFLEKVEVMKETIGEAYYLKAKKLLEGVPNRTTFVHGDCHFKNIMVQGDELLLIDMDTLSHGHPIFELAAIRAPYIAFEEDDPGNNERFLGVSSEDCLRIYNGLLKGYFGEVSPQIQDKIALVCYIHMVWWTMVNTPEDSKRLNGSKQRLFALLDKYDDLDIGI